MIGKKVIVVVLLFLVGYTCRAQEKSSYLRYNLTASSELDAALLVKALSEESSKSAELLKRVSEKYDIDERIAIATYCYQHKAYNYAIALAHTIRTGSSAQAAMRLEADCYRAKADSLYALIGRNIGFFEEKTKEDLPDDLTGSEIQEENVFDFVEQPPVFSQGGDAGILRWINNHRRYPEVSLQQGVEGTVMLRFVVKADGTVGTVQVLKSVETNLDREAVRVIRELPKFSPGRQQGKPVNVWFQIPVRFHIE